MLDGNYFLITYKTDSECILLNNSYILGHIVEVNYENSLKDIYLFQLRHFLSSPFYLTFLAVVLALFSIPTIPFSNLDIFAKIVSVFLL